MNLRCCILFGLFLLPPGLTGGQCSAAPATETLACLHWLGLKQISTQTNATHFMSVWRLPQTAALVAQTLDKFSRWPGGGATNAASALLCPLLDDLVSSESYLELRAPTNAQPLGASNLALAGEGGSASGHQPDAVPRMPSGLNSQLVLALRLPADRARLWQTNLAAVLEALTGLRSVPAGNGWSLRKHEAPDLIEFSRVGEWTLVGLGSGTNDLLAEFAARINHDHAPFARSTTNFWCVADLDPSLLVASISTLDPLSSIALARRRINRLHLTVIGENGNIRTCGTLNFFRPLELLLSPWEIPTNLIHQSLTSFTAVRGLAPWLTGLPAWQKLQLDPPPDQAFCWAQDGVPFLTFFAAPLPSASNRLAQLAGRLVKNTNPWLAINGEGRFEWRTNPPGLIWKGAPILIPYLIPATMNQRQYVLGGWCPSTADDSNPPPAEILRPVLDPTNLVYYQSEQTGQRVEDGAYIYQLLRLMFRKPQLPGASAAGAWLKNVEPLLGDSTTLVTQTGPEQLVFTRKSTIGLTALELHLLADWLESPRFPHGLHTFLAPPDK